MKMFSVVLEEPGRLEPLLLAQTRSETKAQQIQHDAMYANQRVGVKVSLVTRDSADQLQVSHGRALRDQPELDPGSEALTIHVPVPEWRR